MPQSHKRPNMFPPSTCQKIISQKTILENSTHQTAEYIFTILVLLSLFPNLRISPEDERMPSNSHTWTSIFLHHYSCLAFAKRCTPFHRRPVKHLHTQKHQKVTLIRDSISGLLSRFETLKRVAIPKTHPAMISIMNDLAHHYWSLEKWRDAEIWFRRQLSSMETSGEPPTTTKSLSLQVCIIEVLRPQGRCDEALSLHRKVHKMISETGGTKINYLLIADSLDTLGWILRDQGYCTESDMCFRDVLQIRLNALVPRHAQTLQALQQIGSELTSQGRYEESERFLTTILDISMENLGMAEAATCVTMNSLSSTKFSQGILHENEGLSRHLIKNSILIYGEDHPDTLFYRQNLARSLKRQGRVLESEQLVQEVLEQRSKTLGELHVDTLGSMYCLDQILKERMCYGEASEWLGKTFRGYSSFFGADHEKTIIACDILMNCYRELGNIPEALRCLEDFVGKCQTRIVQRGDASYPEERLSQVKKWITYFKVNIMELQKLKDDEGFPYDNETTCSEDAEEGEFFEMEG